MNEKVAILVIERATVIFNLLARHLTRWSCRASERYNVLARTGPAVWKVHRASGPVLMLRAASFILSRTSAATKSTDCSLFYLQLYQSVELVCHFQASMLARCQHMERNGGLWQVLLLLKSLDRSTCMHAFLGEQKISGAKSGEYCACQLKEQLMFTRMNSMWCKCRQSTECMLYFRCSSQPDMLSEVWGTKKGKGKGTKPRCFEETANITHEEGLHFLAERASIFQGLSAFLLN